MTATKTDLREPFELGKSHDDQDRHVLAIKLAIVPMVAEPVGDDLAFVVYKEDLAEQRTVIQIV
jgi:hypothetical protein